MRWLTALTALSFLLTAQVAHVAHVGRFAATLAADTAVESGKRYADVTESSSEAAPPREGMPVADGIWRGPPDERDALDDLDAPDDLDDVDDLGLSPSRTWRTTSLSRCASRFVTVDPSAVGPRGHGNDTERPPRA